MSKTSRLMKKGYFVDGSLHHHLRRHKNGIIHEDWRMGRAKNNIDKSSYLFHNDYVFYMDDSDDSEAAYEYGINKLAVSFDSDLSAFKADEYEYDID